MSESTHEPIKSLPLVMDEPRGRKKPPRHLADLDEAGRKALLEEMGLPGFRAKQLSTHYFGRLVDDPADEREFVRRLEAKGIPTTVRDTRGREIDGACGQLAAKE